MLGYVYSYGWAHLSASRNPTSGMNIMPTLRIAGLLSLGVLLAGCAGPGSLSSGTPAAQVQARLGAPDSITRNTDGSEVWAYPEGPLGRQTYMVTLGPDRTVREVHQVLSEEFFSKVRAGMTRDQVRGLLGKPGEVFLYEARNEEVWSWRYEEQNPMFFNVLFDLTSGRVRITLRLEEIRFMGSDN